MRDTMERMEQERSEMIAEVEAQIERALASMAVDMDDSDYSSRPNSRLSSRSAPSTLRRSGSRARPLRSFSTESTLTDLYAAGMREEGGKAQRTTPVEEVEEPKEGHDNEKDKDTDSVKKRRRFSATPIDGPQDGMTAVDEGISQKSNSIARKVLDIQRKVSPDHVPRDRC